MNHNENEIDVNIQDVYFDQFVNVVHENLLYVIDEFVHVPQDSYVVV
jgi:hypothetical protein